jgi:hypothetical protein
MDKVVRLLDKKVYNPTTLIKNWESEAPSCEVEFIICIKTFDEASHTRTNTSITAVEARMNQTHSNIKILIGIKYTVIKPVIDYEHQDQH